MMPASTAETPYMPWPRVLLIALGVEAALLILAALALDSAGASHEVKQDIVELQIAEPALEHHAEPPKPMPKLQKLPPVPHIRQAVPTPPQPQVPSAPSDVTQAVTPPPPPAAPSSDTAAHEAEFEARLRTAIQNAMVYPPTARMARIAGKTKVSLHFRDGVISHAQVVQGSGSGVLDQAALAAVANAVSPVVPDSLRGRDLDYQIWVSFELKHAL